MGLFDYVHFEMPCPNCGALLREFQTKDLGCDMETVEPDALMNFYDLCHKCKTWVEFHRGYPAHPKRDKPLTEAEVLALGFEKSVRAATDSRKKESS